MARLLTAGWETGSLNEMNGASSAGVRVVTVIKRTGAYSLECTANQSKYHTFDDNESELFVRFAFYISANEDNFDICSFFDDAVGHQVSLHWTEGTQSIDIRVGSGTLASTLKAFGTITIPVATWVMVEAQIVFATSGGTVTVKVNGTTNATWTGNTAPTGDEFARRVRFGTVIVQASGEGGGGASTSYIDDIAIDDPGGSYQNSWIGLGGVFYLYPTADFDVEWTPSAGTLNYAMVDERPPDNATTYNQAVTAGDRDLYEIYDCPTYVNVINLVQVVYHAAVAESGYNYVRDVVNVEGTAYTGITSTVVPITPSFTYYLGTIHYINPNTGTAWGTVEVNAMQAGVEIVA